MLRFKYILFICMLVDCEIICQESYLRDSVIVYVVNRGWHTGILFETTPELIINVTSLHEFSDTRYIEIGWGDEEFYQYPGDFDLWLGAKAILAPTPSVLRIQGYNADFESIIQHSIYCIEIKLSYNIFKNLCRIIEDEFRKDSENKTQIASVSEYANIKFYHAVKYYSLFRTCNTWIAEILQDAGENISSFMLITSEQLFNELTGIGKVIVPPN